MQTVQLATVDGAERALPELRTELDHARRYMPRRAHSGAPEYAGDRFSEAYIEPLGKHYVVWMLRL